jgi:hypothetical protein
MTHQLLMAAAIVATVLTSPIGIGAAEAHGGDFRGGGFHGGDFRGGGFHDRGFFARREFRGNGSRFGGVFGGYYPGYYGYRPCYLTVYGTTACY